MAIKETTETWVRIDLFCDGLGDVAFAYWALATSWKGFPTSLRLQRGHAKQSSTRP